MSRHRGLVVAGMLSRTALFIATLATAGVARAQSARDPWTFTVTGGAFVRGNSQAVTTWLRGNAYGVPQQRCGFNIQLNRVCSPVEAYPQTSGQSVVAGMVSLRRRVSQHFSGEVFVANEQSGTTTGRCDTEATPRDTRCTIPFLVVDFGGASFATLVVAQAWHVKLGAGPALLLANWPLRPAHLGGLWLDAAIDLGSRPWLVRAQYRVYGATTRMPAEGFTRFHPSTLLLGLGFAPRSNN